jgi:hypothetical protein
MIEEIVFVRGDSIKVVSPRYKEELEAQGWKVKDGSDSEEHNKAVAPSNRGNNKK